MQIYKNINGKSGIYSYEIGVDYIVIKFLDYWVYTYTYNSEGKFNIDEMKKLAIRGHGLNSFISRVVKKMYSSKKYIF